MYGHKINAQTCVHTQQQKLTSWLCYSFLQQAERKEEEIDGDKGQQPKPTPYVVFVGQLPFSCTDVQVIEHFQPLELQAPMKVR